MRGPPRPARTAFADLARIGALPPRPGVIGPRSGSRSGARNADCSERPGATLALAPRVPT
jgi:hypothetical protein